jgi:hypothetical protein
MNVYQRDTPIADATINAADAAKKTVYLLTSLSEANSIVASWVLFPGPAIKIATNIVMNIFQSICKFLFHITHNG